MRYLSRVGAHQERQLRIAGEDLDGVAPGAAFLRDLNLGRPVTIGHRVAVVGGGNVAIDAARSALRLGAESVTIVYRRSRAEMPASAWEVEDAEEEGIRFHFLANPIRILGQDGPGASSHVAGIECLRMELGEPDASGRRRPIPIEGSEFLLDVDMVIPAIGQTPDLGFVNSGELQVTRWGTLVVDPDTLATGATGRLCRRRCRQRASHRHRGHRRGQARGQEHPPLPAGARPRRTTRWPARRSLRGRWTCAGRSKQARVAMPKLAPESTGGAISPRWSWASPRNKPWPRRCAA